MKVWVHPRAEQDLGSAARFYQQSGAPQIADRFIMEFHRVVKLLQEQPGLGTTVNAERRRMPLNVFPYAVIYRATSSELRVLAVKHDRQHPRFGSTRD